MFLELVNECDTIPNVCGPHAVCADTQESYNCTCVSGYEFNASSICDSMSLPFYAFLCELIYIVNADIDECTKYSDICPSGICNDTQGNYTCSCLSGYIGTYPDCVGKSLSLTLPLILFYIIFYKIIL